MHPLELELRTVKSHLTEVLGAEIGSSGRGVRALKAEFTPKPHPSSQMIDSITRHTVAFLSWITGYF